MADHSTHWDLNRLAGAKIHGQPSTSTNSYTSPVARAGVRAVNRAASSSTNTTDDDDDDGNGCDNDDVLSTVSYKDRRREAHTLAEQKRRDSIKRGYEDLQHMVPTCQQTEPPISQPDGSFGGSSSNSKLSKAVVLQRSIEYIQFLVHQQKKQMDEVESLRKEVLALKIMKLNYEQMVKSHQNAPTYGDGIQQLPDDLKVNVYQNLTDNLFHSFDNTVSVASFSELSACIIYWLEENCKPRILREMMLNALQQATAAPQYGRHHPQHHHQYRPM